FFFFQAEDGIRDGHVTGVQTCALPIFRRASRAARGKVSAERRAARADHRAPSRGVSSQRLTQRRRARLRRTLPGLLTEVRNRIGGSQLTRSEYEYRRGDERFRKRLLLPR